MPEFATDSTLCVKVICVNLKNYDTFCVKIIQTLHKQHTQILTHAIPFYICVLNKNHYHGIDCWAICIVFWQICADDKIFTYKYQLWLFNQRIRITARVTGPPARSLVKSLPPDLPPPPISSNCPNVSNHTSSHLLDQCPTCWWSTQVRVRPPTIPAQKS